MASATSARDRAPKACADCGDPKKPPVLKFENDTQRTYACPKCGMEHSVAINQGRK